VAAVPYKVYVVVDRAFGERLANLGPGVPVWIVNTPPNKKVACRLWEERPWDGHLTGITTFRDMDFSSPEELLLQELDAIELHHGSYSANPPYTVLEVLGAVLSPRIESELSSYGFSEFQPSPAGFRAMRPEPLD